MTLNNRITLIKKVLYKVKHTSYVKINWLLTKALSYIVIIIVMCLLEAYSLTQKRVLQKFQ